VVDVEMFEIELSPLLMLESIGDLRFESASDSGEASVLIEAMDSVSGSRKTTSQLGRVLNGPSFAGEFGNNRLSPCAASDSDTFAEAPADFMLEDRVLLREDVDLETLLDNPERLAAFVILETVSFTV